MKSQNYQYIYQLANVLKPEKIIFVSMDLWNVKFENNIDFGLWLR